MERLQSLFSGTNTQALSGGTSYFLITVLLIAVLVGIGYFVLYKRANTMPNITPFEDMTSPEKDDEEETKEGFYAGPARGAGIPDCLRTSADAARLHEMFQGRVGGTEEGPADFSEFTILLSQLSCFKRDLLGVAQQVEATRYQPFATQIDIEPIAETTARCFAKTIPPRDLDIALDKWYKRGHFLITRLCTSANLKEEEVVEAEKRFDALMKDISSVAKETCLSGTPTINAQATPRDPVPSSSSDITGEDYKGYY